MAEGLVVPVKTLYEKENWKIYTCEVSREYKYHFDGTDTISIAGDIPSLVLGVPYKIIADAKKTKYGLTYYVKTAMIALSNDGVGSYDTFLKNITTDRQFESIKKAYPNFVNMIIADETADIDYRKIFGTGQKGLEKIIAKVVDNLVIAEIINEYGEFGVTFNMAKKMYKRYGNVHAIRRRMENEPYKILCSIQGISFKTADAIIKKKRPEMIDSPDRLFECLKFLLDEMENSEGSTYMNYASLYKKANALVPEAIKNMIKVLDNPEFKWNGESKRVSRKETFDKELFIAKKLLELRDSKSKKFDWGKEPDYEKFRSFDGITLTDEQMSSLSTLFSNNVVLLRAGAGMGKSSSTKAIVNMLDHLNKSVVLLAPTGAASEVLSEYTGREASTIHREIYSHMKRDEQGDSSEFGFDEVFDDDTDDDYDDSDLDYSMHGDKISMIEADVVIVDECSMINTDLMYRLLLLINPETTKIMFVQDTEQLPAIGAGRLSMDIIESGEFPVITLTKVFRYTDGGLMKVASDIREGHKYTDDDFEKAKQFGNNKDYVLIKAPKTVMLSHIRELYGNLIKNGATVQDIGVISAMNVYDIGTVQINEMLQNFMIPKGTKSLKVGNKEFRIGDKVVQLENNYKARTVSKRITPLFNGNQGMISDIDENTKTIYVDYGKKGKTQTFVYDVNEIKKLGLAYALSVHKFQGSSAKYIIYVQPASHTYMVNKNLLYTALTRTRTKCYHIVENVFSVNNAIKKSENDTRNTYVKEMLNLLSEAYKYLETRKNA